MWRHIKNNCGCGLWWSVWVVEMIRAVTHGWEAGNDFDFCLDSVKKDCDGGWFVSRWEDGFDWKRGKIGIGFEKVGWKITAVFMVVVGKWLVMEELQQAVDGCCVRLWQLDLLIGGHCGCIDGGFVAWREALFDYLFEVIPSLLVSHLFFDSGWLGRSDFFSL